MDNNTAPPGWVTANPPADLRALYEWLRTRAAWVRGWWSDETRPFPPEWQAEIELTFANDQQWSTDPQRRRDEAKKLIQLYLRNMFLSVNAWLDWHGIHGYPIWSDPVDGKTFFFHADEHLSKLLSFLCAAAGVKPGGRTADKRSTEKGEARVKLIAALTKHHNYADGGCLKREPIGNNKLARAAEVSPSTATAFFNKEFNKGEKGGHAKYKVICRDAGRLADSLKVINGEFSPHDLYGRRPPGEDDRDDDRDNDDE